MTDNLYNLFRCAILFTGLLSLPLFGFSQQEEPKRVTVVVTAKEITQEKEVVQLPADNAPKKTAPLAKKKSFPAKASASKENTVVKTTAIAKRTNTPAEKPKAVVPAKPKAIPPHTEETKLAQHKPIVSEDKKPAEKLPEQKTTTAVPKTAPVTAQTKTSKSTEQVNSKTNIAVKDKNENEEFEDISYTSTTNSFSYIWIGAFLIIAGVVLGLLFGKPAFLISFVGIVFVVLGVLI